MTLSVSQRGLAEGLMTHDHSLVVICMWINQTLYVYQCTLYTAHCQNKTWLTFGGGATWCAYLTSLGCISGVLGDRKNKHNAVRPNNHQMWPNSCRSTSEAFLEADCRSSVTKSLPAAGGEHSLLHRQHHRDHYWYENQEHHARRQHIGEMPPEPRFAPTEYALHSFVHHDE